SSPIPKGSSTWTRRTPLLTRSVTDMPVMDAEQRRAWLKERMTGLGASDIPVLFGLSTWKSPYSLWLEKTGLQEPEGIGRFPRGESEQHGDVTGPEPRHALLEPGAPLLCIHHRHVSDAPRE